MDAGYTAPPKDGENAGQAFWDGEDDVAAPVLDSQGDEKLAP